MKIFYTVNNLDIQLPRLCRDYRFRYQGQAYYQPSYIVLIPASYNENAKMYADYSGEISRNCMSFDVYHSRELHFPFPSSTTLKDLRNLMNKIAPLMSKLAESYDTYIDGQGNLCGRWNKNIIEMIYFYIDQETDSDFCF